MAERVRRAYATLSQHFWGAVFMYQATLNEMYIKQLTSISDELFSALDRGIESGEAAKLVAQSRAAIERITGTNSVYAQQAREATKSPYVTDAVHEVVGVVDALAEDLKNGYLQSLSELIHGEVFSDYLEMANHLLSEGYKDAAAVIAGGTIEAHLKQLCTKHNVDTESTDNKGRTRNKKASMLNSELRKANAYGLQDQQSITSWLNLRNDAAHANYQSYEAPQVRLMIESIREFIRRVPA